MADASEYGRALLMLSDELGSTEKVLQDLTDVKKILEENPEYADLADTPALPSSVRLELIVDAFSGIDGNLLNLMKLLCEKREFYKIPGIASSYCRYYDEEKGILRVTAVTAVPMSPSQIASLGKKLEAKTGKTVVIGNTVDPSVLGGVKLRYAGVQLDGTLRANLMLLEKKLEDLKL